MAGTVTVTEETSKIIKKIVWSWTASAGGAADQATSNAYDGVVEGVRFVPNTDADQPTDAYDITITDADSKDVLLGVGANLSNAAEVAFQGPLGCAPNDKLTLNVSNAGNAKKGTVYLYIR